MFTGAAKSVQQAGGSSSSKQQQQRPEDQQQEFNFSRLLSPGSSRASTLTAATNDNNNLSMVKIIDVQRSRRKSPTTPQSSETTAATRPQEQSWPSQQQQQEQQSKTRQSENQKQPSGETLSSFESDYDLLVYLGETETEDIVDTERSLDYQDQTWRQSICGGASLAPTIDDSLNDGFLSQASNYQVPPLRNAIANEDDFDLLNTPTPTAATFGSGSPFFSPPTAASITSRLTQPPTTTAATQSHALRRADELQVESDDCDNEVSLVFQRNKQPVPRVSQRRDNHHHQTPTKRIGDSRNIGEKLFNGRQQHPNDEQEVRMVEASRGQQASEKSKQTMSSGHDDGAAELDRLLAEMNESLDLKSLARYDPLAGSRFPDQRAHRQVRSQTLNPRASQQQQQQAISSPSTHQSSRNLNTEARWTPPSSGQAPARQTESEASSVLDEYDGASKILEQMISDQLLMNTTNQTTRQQARPAVATKASGGGFPGSEQLDNESPTKTATAATTTATTTASSTRKVSTCSSSVATEASSVVLATSRIQPTAAAAAEPPTAKADRLPGGWSRRGSSRKQIVTAKQQSSSFDQGLPSTQLGKPTTRQVFSSLANTKPSQSFDRALARKNSDSSGGHDRPPTPPEVDYNKNSVVMHEVDHEGGQVIRLEAAEFPQDDEEQFDQSNKQDTETQIDRMKRRTLSSMRSMRNKFNDFITINKQHPQQSNGVATDRSQQRPPQPPKRSSSMGSQSSINHQPSKEAKPQPEQQARESRSRAPRRAGQQSAAAEKQSFGQQIKERLSRSKSRFAKFLQKPAARAQSMPSKKERPSLEPYRVVDDSELFQPSDIARNSGEKRRDSFDESLDRHLAASLSAPPKKQTSSSSSPSSSSLSSELSGLDTTKSNARSRQQIKRAANQSDRERSREKRPSSLASLRRLGSLRSPQSRNNNKEPEDVDSIQVKTSSEIPTAANRKLRNKSKTKSPVSSGGRVSPLETSHQQKLTRTGDYFGKVAPLKATDSLEDDKSPTTTDDLRRASPSASKTKLQPAEVGVQQRNSPDADNRSAKSMLCGEERPKRKKTPNRSQSMKSVNSERRQQDLQNGARTVSFSNLQPSRRLAATNNTFRPASACAKLEQDSTTLNGNQMSEARAEGAVTPIGLSNDPLSGRRLESTKPAQLEHHTQQSGRLTPTIRAKGAAMIDDIRHKCSELFSSGDHSSRGRQSRVSAQVQQQQQQQQVQQRQSRPPEPPVRPPRKRGLHQRSKSVSARPAISAEPANDGDELYAVELRPATPGSSLNRHTVEQSPNRSQRQSPVGEKLASFAQQLKQQFFQQQSAPVDRRRSQAAKSPPRLRAPNETIVPAGRDLLEWKPVIKTTAATSGAGRSFRVLGAKGDESSAHDRTGEHDSSSSSSSDSTWESSTASLDQRDEIVHNQTKSAAPRLADESSQLVAADKPLVANEPSRAAAAATTADGSSGTNSSAGNRLHSAGDDDVDKVQEDRNNNNSGNGKELLKRYQQQQHSNSSNSNNERDAHVVVSDHHQHLKIIRLHQQQQQQQQQQETPAEAVVANLDENCGEHHDLPLRNNNIDAPDRSAAAAAVRTSMKSTATYSKPKAERSFKFNANLPTPEQLLQEEQTAAAADKMTRVALRPKEEEENKQQAKQDTHQQDEDLEAANRLSLYDNVSQPTTTAATTADDEARRRQWRKPDTVAPHVPSKPAHLTPGQGSDLIGAISERIPTEAGQPKKKKSDSSDDDWSTSDNNDPVAPQSSPPQRTSPEQVIAAVSKERPKLVAMTSIIHDPIDDLMEARPSERVSAPQQQQQTQTQSRLQRRDSKFGTNESVAASAAAADSDDTDSSFAAAAASRRRLVRKFVEQQQQPKPETTRAKFPPASTARGDSLVKRMARNFDQTVQQQEPPASHRRPPVAPAPQKKISYTTKTTTTIVKSFDDDSSAAADWCDAKSVDEQEVAEFLQDFDGSQSRPAGPREASEACSSVSTGAYVTVADSTLNGVDQSDADDRGYAEQRPAASAPTAAQTGTTSDDDTLNDDDMKDEIRDEDATAANEDDDDDDDDDDYDDNDDLVSDRSYTSARGTLPRVAAVAAEANHQHQKQQQQGKASPPASSRPGNAASPVGGGELSPTVPTPESRVPEKIKAKNIRQTVARTADDEQDEGGDERDDKLLIDTTFKTSLNRIIARRSSSSSQVNNEPKSRRDSSEPAENRPDRKTKSSRELRGLSKLYHALLGHQWSASSKNKPKGEDYIHSSSSSASASDSEDDRDDNSEDEVSMDDKRLVAAAKKCSRIYEELERILERRLACKENHNNKPQTTDRRKADNKQVLAVVKRDSDGLNYEQSLGTIMSVATTSSTKTSTPTTTTTTTKPNNDHRESSVSLEDRVSLSSSSTEVSSESVSVNQQQQQLLSNPEIRQRKNLQKLYHVVNEICSSEAKFVDTLRLLNVDFRQHIESADSNAAGQPVIPQEKLQSMLKHLPQLQALNENLLAELELARQHWPQTQKIAHVLVKIGPFLKHYSTYIREFESMQQQYQENLKKHPQFAERVREFESSDSCKKLTIQHHILKPIQRIPQYRLLLQQYLHNLKPDDVDYEDTVEALEVVSRVAEHANHSMSEGVNFAKLLALQAKIVGKQRDIVQPGRVFIKEGELAKVCRKQIQPRWFVLLNDALLYLTQVQSSDILFLKNELPLDGCLVSVADEQPAASSDGSQQQQQQQHNNINHVPPQPQPPADDTIQEEQQQLEHQPTDREFSVSTRMRSFALIAKSRAERDEWVACLRRTVEEYMAKRRSFVSKLYANVQQPAQRSGEEQQQQEPAEKIIDEPIKGQQHCLLGQMAPIWTPDSRVSRCQLCTSSFSALFRRHHCRACGRVVCSACSSNKAPLIYLKCRAARVCDECFDTLKANIHLYYLPASSSSSAAGGSSVPLSDAMAAAGGQPLIGEQELRRLDEHFRTLLKSQFKRTTSLSKLTARNGVAKRGKKAKSASTSLLPVLCPATATATKHAAARKE